MHEVHGPIFTHYQALGGAAGFLGAPVTDQTTTPDGIGRYNHFQYGSMYWTSSTGAHEVHGAIRDKWAQMNWENGILGYPLSDEATTPDGRARYSIFDRGLIYAKGGAAWMNSTHSVAAPAILGGGGLTQITSKESTAWGWLVGPARSSSPLADHR